jgi:multiple sugar transport system permease protein
MANKKMVDDPKPSAGLAARKVVAYIVLGILSFICLFFFYLLLVNATRAHSDIMKGFSPFFGKKLISNYKGLMSHDNLPVIRGMLNSLFVSTCCAILCTYFSSLTAYAIHAYDFKFKTAIFNFILLVMTIPAQVSALGFVKEMYKFNLINSYIPLIIPTIAAPSVFFFMKQYMDSSLPMEIIEASRIDGSGEFRTFNAIVLPIMKPALSVQAIFTFVGTWNNYFTPNLIISKDNMKTLPILIATLRAADYLKFNMGEVYMMIALSIFPVVIIYLWLSKYIVAGVALGSVKG